MQLYIYFLILDTISVDLAIVPEAYKVSSAVLLFYVSFIKFCYHKIVFYVSMLSSPLHETHKTINSLSSCSFAILFVKSHLD